MNIIQLQYGERLTSIISMMILPNPEHRLSKRQFFEEVY
jgi:hypothetical protein